MNRLLNSYGTDRASNEQEHGNSTRVFPILVVEDNPVSRKLLEKTLRNSGYETVSVANGREALELLSKRFFPIVLTDWIMPEMDGLQLCQAIRKSTTPGYVFIILLTARDSKDDMIAGLEAGADDYLTKPFSHAELKARLKTGFRILTLERFLRKANEEIRTLSITDPLTGSYNRGYMNDRLPIEVKRARRYTHPLSICMCDLDCFKRVNDTYGHQAGDFVLKAFAERINRAIRTDVDWVVRYGGEEFLIVLPETDVQGACTLAERLRKLVCEKKFVVQTVEIQISASFGVMGFDASTPDGKVSPEALIKKADEYLYQAKKGGRNRVTGGSL